MASDVKCPWTLGFHCKIKRMQQKSGNIHSKTMTNSSLKLGSTLMILTLIVSAMAVLFVIHAETDDSSAEIIDQGQCGSTAYYTVDSGGTLNVYGSGKIRDYINITDAPWTKCCSMITKIVIGEDITYLGKWAFAGCVHAEELTIPITLNSVSYDAKPSFAGCCNIQKINFTCGNGGCGYNYAAYPGSNSWYQNTPWYQSRDCLMEINFADGIKEIGSDSFRELNITSLVIPDTVVGLGCHCFYNCIKLTDLTISVSLNSYGNEKYPAFWGCTAINKVTFTRGNGVPFDYTNFWGEKNSGLAPWNLNGNVVKTIVISDDVPYLGNYMFRSCNIRDLTLPVNCVDDRSSRYAFQAPYDSLENVTITKGTCAGCDYLSWYAETHLPWNGTNSLKCVTVEDGVTRLGSYMFHTCHTETMILPNSLGILGEYTFSQSVITYLTIPVSLNTVWLGNSPAFDKVSGIEKITFIPGSGEGFNYAAYSGSNCWYQLTPWYQCRGSLNEIVFENGILYLGSDAFRELNITSLVLPDSVRELNNHTFYHCDKLISIVIPINVNNAYSEQYPAFEQCNAVEDVKLTYGFNGIGADYFDCTSFWSIQKPTHISIAFVLYIGAHTFEGLTFFTPSGEKLWPGVYYLRGLSFTKTGDATYVVDSRSDGAIPAYVQF